MVPRQDPQPQGLAFLALGRRAPPGDVIPLLPSLCSSITSSEGLPPSVLSIAILFKLLVMVTRLSFPN